MADSLNRQQQEAVQCTEGPLLILAGAGSGKTRVLTYRIAHLIKDKGVSPYNIMAITFTNKAAAEMRERVDRIAGESAQAVWVATFHSSCVRILRRYIDRIGYDNAFTIYDADDQKTVVKNIIKRLNLDTKTYRERNVISAISSCKDELVSPEAYAASTYDHHGRQTARIYSEYQNELRRNNALDFDDLIVKTIELFERCPDVLESYQERFRYIMVDEYQDTNTAQFRLVQLLAGRYRNICAVGDDDQSIYRFRGANIGNILSFEKAFKGAKVIKLEQNYRSTGNILNAANAVIHHNRGRKDKTLWTSREDGARIGLFQYDTAYDEADAVIRAIRDACTDGDYSRYAVLYRTNAQSRLLEERCVSFGLPYQLIGGVNFYQRREIKDMLAYVKTIANGRDDVACMRIINVPKRGIGATTTERLAQYAQTCEISFFDACTRAEEAIGAGKAAARVTAFAQLMTGYRKRLADGMSIKELIESLVEDTGYAQELAQEGDVEAQTRLENIGELVSKASEYDDINDFLEEVALVAEVDALDETQPRITLMTMHGAKGLEFPHVFLTGMEEGLFPSSMSINADDREALEEERRLCYVGITRAKDDLMLTFARSRMVNGEMHWSKASRFVEEIPDEYLDKHLLEKNYGQSSTKSSYFADDDYPAKRPAYGFGSPVSGIGGGYAPGSKSVSGAKSGAEKNTNYTGGEGSGYRSNGYGTGASGRPGGAGALSAISLGRDMKQAAMTKPDYEVGDRVSHTKFGVGTVRQIRKGARDYEVDVDFDGVGMRTLMAGFAKLQRCDMME